MAIIGRERPADIVIPMPQVSACHAEITHQLGDLYYIRDLGSTNGVFVNGQRVQAASLTLSDQLRLGSLHVDLRAYAHLIPRNDPRPAPAYRAQPVAIQQPIPVQPSVAPPPVSVPAPVVNIQQSGPSPVDTYQAMQIAIAAQKSFVGPAFLTWFLYWLGWLPGFIMNIVYMNEAGRIRKLTGQSPSGYGCLVFLFIFCGMGTVLAIVFFFLVLGGTVASFR